MFRNFRLSRDRPLPRQGHATRIIWNVPLSLQRFMRAMRMWNLAVWVFRHDACTECFGEAHPRLDPVAGMVSGPAPAKAQPI